MIEAKDIRKAFGDKTILDGVSAVMEPGKCNLVIGSSGSGKTVFMKCLVGLFKPDSGEILYGGKNFVTMNGEECHNEWEITFEEIHRTSAMAYAMRDYIEYTGDENYFVEYGLLLWAAGFGIVHIIYGIYIHFKYER